MKGKSPREERQIPVFVVVQPRTLLLDIAGPLEVLRRANREQKSVRFDVQYVGPLSEVMSSIGLRISNIAPLPVEVPDGAMIVVSGDVDVVLGSTAASSTKEESKACERIVVWLKQHVTEDHLLVTICSGALLAAKAGLLDGYSCTTHHLSCSALQSVAPSAKVQENRLYVEDRRRFTSAGITAGIDLMLHIVSQFTDYVCVAAIARYLVLYLRRSGGDPQLSPWLDGRNHLHPAVHHAQDLIAANPAGNISLDSMARKVGLSSRQLTRLFAENTGATLTEYRNRLRIALAQELLRQTSFDVEQVAERTGFGSSRHLRRAWKEFLGGSPKEGKSARIRC